MAKGTEGVKYTVQEILNWVFDRETNTLDMADGSSSNTNVYVDNETPSGAINGVNINFTTYYSYKPNTTKLFLNGLRQREGLGFDYIENGANTIKFANAPISGDTLTIDYIKL